MATIEVSITDVSQLIGISENQLYKNFKRCEERLKEYNILYEGVGKSRKFYQVESDIPSSKEKVAYDIFKEIAYNVWKFNRQTNIDKLLYYMGLILSKQKSESDASVLSTKEIARQMKVSESTIRKYKKILVSNNVFKPSNLSKMVTYISTEYMEFNTRTSTLIPYADNTEDCFKYRIKIVNGEPAYQFAEEKILVDNELMDTFNKLVIEIANRANMKNQSDYNRVKSMFENGEKALNVNMHHKYLAFDYFKRELGITKLWSVYKTEYEPAFMKDDIMLDIITNAFNYKFNDIKKITRNLEGYNIIYLDDSFKEVLDLDIKNAS
ncbi:response regulator transcription factor [Romboutsia sp. 1001216sp1]|uniref:response regulator transcription factor n=1 Tax=unclassified Romboutsia TaxID=2626894 RepID=UPI0018A0CEB8|nr:MULTISPECIES: response regulator transcription factor [unclassified Romboutsia]MDB8802756.1 response regulator transcription factor [Romboutsia sp. 1001216sp1]MDB8814153.1 response regulator transcription factor [Romboutsia sp. 1001216sp1]